MENMLRTKICDVRSKPRGLDSKLGPNLKVAIVNAFGFL